MAAWSSNWSSNICGIEDPLPPVVVERIRPIFKDLADLRLLENCTRCLTQNANESLHSVIWSLAPKEEYKSANEVAVGLGCMFSTKVELQLCRDCATLQVDPLLWQQSHWLFLNALMKYAYWRPIMRNDPKESSCGTKPGAPAMHGWMPSLAKKVVHINPASSM